MRPLVRSVVRVSRGMGVHLDEASKLYARRGYMDPVELVKKLPWVESWETPLRESWESSALKVLLRARATSRQDKAVHKELSLDENAPLSTQETLALEFLENEGASLVRALSAQNRSAMVRVLDQAIREGWAIPKIVQNIKSMIGLLPNQAAAVLKKQDAWLAQGWTEKRVAAAVERYSARLLRQRAENIARTETVRALNQGQLQAWKGMVDEGQLPVTVKRVWIPAVSERTCPICIELGGLAPVGLFQPFVSPSVGSIMAPPAHPSCRCSMGLV
jgi:hypothetical protein